MYRDDRATIRRALARHFDDHSAGDRQAEAEIARWARVDAERRALAPMGPEPLAIGGPHALTGVDYPTRLADDGAAYYRQALADRLVD